MLTWIYRIIVVLVAMQVVVCMFHEKSWKKQFNACWCSSPSSFGH